MFDPKEQFTFEQACDVTRELPELKGKTEDDVIEHTEALIMMMKYDGFLEEITLDNNQVWYRRTTKQLP